jgi:hypothetical protein
MRDCSRLEEFKVKEKKIPDRVPTKSGPNPLSMGKLYLNRAARL